MKKHCATIAFAAASFLFLIVISPVFAGDAVVRVNDAVLTEKDVAPVMDEIMPARSFHGSTSSEKRKGYREKAIEILVQRELLYQEAVKRGMKVKRDSIDAVKDATVKRLGNRQIFEVALKQWNLTESEYEKRIERDFLIRDIKKEEIEDRSAVKDSEVKEYYENNMNSFFMPGAVRIRHIFVKVDPSSMDEERTNRYKRAEEVLAKLKAGGDFGELAWDYSDDEYRVKGGDFGFVHKGRLVPELETRVFRLKTGELSDIIETIYGYHIVRVEEKKEPLQIPIEEAKIKIKKQLYEKKLKENEESFMSGLRAKAKIERMNEVD